MFDFNKYNLGELVAISDMLDYIKHGGRVDYQQEKCREAINQNVSRQAMDQLQTFRESLVRAWLIEQAEEQAEAEASGLFMGHDLGPDDPAPEEADE